MKLEDLFEGRNTKWTDEEFDLIYTSAKDLNLYTKMELAAQRLDGKMERSSGGISIMMARLHAALTGALPTGASQSSAKSWFASTISTVVVAYAISKGHKDAQANIDKAKQDLADNPPPTNRRVRAPGARGHFVNGGR